MKKLLLIAVSTIVFAGCGDIRVIRNDQVPLIGYSYDKSYQIGKEKTEFAGDSIVKWSKYPVEYFKEPQVFVAKYNFKINGLYIKRDILRNTLDDLVTKGDAFYLFGTTQYESENYYVIGKNIKKADKPYIEGDNDYYLLVDKKGVLNRNILIDQHLDRKLIAAEQKTKTPEIMFDMISILPDKNRKEFTKELIFGGVNNVTVSATYREYTGSDMARPAFYQNLIYPTSADTIRFQGFNIKVREATNERITFTVIYDGLKDVEPESVNGPQLP